MKLVFVYSDVADPYRATEFDDDDNSFVVVTAAAAAPAAAVLPLLLVRLPLYGEEG